MPYNILNKKKWFVELAQLTKTYVQYIDGEEDDKNIEIDLILSKKYKVSDMIFTGQEIVDNIQKELSNVEDYIYEFKVIDNKPIIRKTYRVSFDDQQKIELEKQATGIVSIEDLKSSYVEAKREIVRLRKELDQKKIDNFDMFKDLIEAMGGLYVYASKKKLILMFSKLLKDFNFYNDNKGTQYSFKDLSDKNKEKVISAFFYRVYK